MSVSGQFLKRWVYLKYAAVAVGDHDRILGGI